MATILITGATGHVGSELVKQLVDSGHTLRALVRDADKAHLPEGVQKIVGDLGKQETLGPALAGIERVYLVDSSHGQDFTNNMVEAAKAAGVKLIVDQSSIGAGLDPMPIMGKWHYDREQTIRASGIDWTFLRPSNFMTNSFFWLQSIKKMGEVRDPIGPGKISPIDPYDIAAVAAAALTQDGHTGKTYTLTGGELLTVKEQVQILAGVLGHPIRYVEISPDDAAKAMIDMGMDAGFVKASRDLNELLRAGRAATLSKDVEKVTGRKPKSFESWCLRNSAAFK